MAVRRGPFTGERVLVLAVLLVAGMLSLPTSAYFLDGSATENLILPVALLVMAGLGAALGAALPDFAGADASPSRGALTGAVVGVLMSLVGLAVFFLLVSGLSGA